MSFGSNYPPGVTGNEYAISGPDYEETETKACPNEACAFVPLAQVNDGLADVQHWLMQMSFRSQPLSEQIDKAVADLTKLLGALDQVEMPCDWTGEVDVQGYQGQKWWNCPRCGTEHTEESDEEDPRDYGDDRD